MRRTTSQREAERLFLRLRQLPDTPLIENGTIEVIYPERFASGKAILAIIIPVKDLPLGAARKQLEAMRSTAYPPILNGDRNGGSLILFIPCPQITQDDVTALRRAAVNNKEWAKDLFRFRHAIITPGGARVTMLDRLGALSPA